MHEWSCPTVCFGVAVDSVCLEHDQRLCLTLVGPSEAIVPPSIVTVLCTPATTTVTRYRTPPLLRNPPLFVGSARR